MKLRPIAIAAFVFVLLLGVVFGRPEHPHFFWEAIPGFYALFGFAGAGLMILVFRRLGEAWLQRDQNYYEEHGE